MTTRSNTWVCLVALLFAVMGTTMAHAFTFSGNSTRTAPESVSIIPTWEIGQAEPGDTLSVYCRDFLSQMGVAGQVNPMDCVGDLMQLNGFTTDAEADNIAIGQQILLPSPRNTPAEVQERLAASRIPGLFGSVGALKAVLGIDQLEADVQRAQTTADRGVQIGIAAADAVSEFGQDAVTFDLFGWKVGETWAIIGLAAMAFLALVAALIGLFGRRSGVDQTARERANFAANTAENLAKTELPELKTSVSRAAGDAATAHQVATTAREMAVSADSSAAEARSAAETAVERANKARHEARLAVNCSFDNGWNLVGDLPTQDELEELSHGGVVKVELRHDFGAQATVAFVKAVNAFEKDGNPVTGLYLHGVQGRDKPIALRVERMIGTLRKASAELHGRKIVGLTPQQIAELRQGVATEQSAAA